MVIMIQIGIGGKMKKTYLCLIIFVGFLLLTGCQSKLKGLPDKPIIFNTGALSVDNGDSVYTTVEYNDKVYIVYGNIKSKGLFGDISYAFGDCLGYVEDDKSRRIYAFADESTDEWLIEYYIDGIMENPVVLREITAKYKKDTPEGVNPFEDDYWK